MLLTGQFEANFIVTSSKNVIVTPNKVEDLTFCIVGSFFIYIKKHKIFELTFFKK